MMSPVCPVLSCFSNRPEDYFSSCDVLRFLQHFQLVYYNIRYCEEQSDVEQRHRHFILLLAVLFGNDHKHAFRALCKRKQNMATVRKLSPFDFEPFWTGLWQHQHAHLCAVKPIFVVSKKKILFISKLPLSDKLFMLKKYRKHGDCVRSS